MKKTLSRTHGLPTRLLSSLITAGIVGMPPAAAMAQGTAATAHTLPSGASVQSGSVTFSNPTANLLQIDQTSSRAIINWQQFSIGAGNTVRFVQPDANAIVLNRVTSDQMSVLSGQLAANGQVWLLNANGIVVNRGAEISAQGVVLSTRALTDQQFLTGQQTGAYAFSAGSKPGSAVINLGTITAANGGYAVLAGESVRNEGMIQTTLGTVVLGGAKTFVMDMVGDRLLSFAVTAPVDVVVADDVAATGESSTATGTGSQTRAVVENTGDILANGGRVLIRAQAAAGVVDRVINVGGLVQADSVRLENGSVLLGDVRIDGGASGTTVVNGVVNARGDDEGLKGGVIRITSEHIVAAANARLNASGNAGGGEILLGADWQVAPIEDATIARTVRVESGAVLDASAVVNGNGGTVTANSDLAAAGGLTTVNGTLLARGGVVSGDGGRIETSGRRIDVTVGSGSAAARSASGKAGEWLFDPYNVTITNTSNTGQTVDGGSFAANADNSTIYAAQINNLLNAGTSVTVTTGTGGSQDGDIFVNSAISKTSIATDQQSPTLTLSAARDINVNASITGTGLNVALNAGTERPGRLNIAAVSVSADQLNLVGELNLATGSTVSAIGSSGGNAGNHGVQITGNVFGSGSIKSNAGILITGDLSGNASIGTPANFTLVQTGNSAFAGVITGTDSTTNTPGAGTFTKAGAGQLTLTASQSYSGTTTIAAGALILGAPDISSGTAIAFSSSGFVNSGTLNITNTQGLSTPTITGSGNIILGSRTLTVTAGANDANISGVISGTGRLALTGGTLRLSGNNTYSGLTDIGTAILTASHNNALGDSSAGTTVANGGTLVIDGGQSGLTLAEALKLSGTGVALATGTRAGALLGKTANASATNTLNGNLTLLDTDVVIATASQTSATTPLPSAAGNLTFGGSINGTAGLTVNSAGTVTFNASIGNSSPIAFLRTDSLGKTVINADITTQGHQTYNDAVEVTGMRTLWVMGNGVHIADLTDGLPAGSFRNIKGQNPSGVTEGPAQAFDGSTATKWVVSEGTNNGFLIDLGQAGVVTGLGLTTANDTYQHPSFNYAANPGRDPRSFELYGSDTAGAFNGTLIASGTLTSPLASFADFTPVNFQNSTAYRYYTLSFPTRDSGNTGGRFELQLSEVRLPGKLDNISFNGPISADGGLALKALKDVNFAATANTAITGNLSVEAGNAIMLAGNSIRSSGQQIFTGALSGSGTLGSPLGVTVNQSTNTVFSGVITGTNNDSASASGSGSFTKTGTGELALSAPQTYTGATNIEQGRIVLSPAQSPSSSTSPLASSAINLNSGTSLSIQGYNGLSVGTLAGAGNIDLGAATLTLVNASDTFDGVISGSGGIALQGGNLTLTSDQIFTGQTLINNGTLTLSPSQPTNDLTLSLATSKITVGSAGTLNLTNNPGFTIPSIVGAGSINMGSHTLSITNASSGVTYSPTHTQTAFDEFSGSISGTGGVSLLAGTLILSGNSSYAGNTLVSSTNTNNSTQFATLIAKSANALGNPATGNSTSPRTDKTIVNAGSTLVIDGGSSGVALAENLDLSGAGLSFVSDSTTSFLGVLRSLASVSNATNTVNGSVTLSQSDALISAQVGNLAFAGDLNGPRGLNINSVSTVTFNSAVGAGTPLAFLSTGTTGSTAINANITTTGSQIYGNTVTVTGNRLLTAGGDIIATAAPFSVLNSLDLDAPGRQIVLVNPANSLGNDIRIVRASNVDLFSLNSHTLRGANVSGDLRLHFQGVSPSSETNSLEAVSGSTTPCASEEGTCTGLQPGSIVSYGANGVFANRTVSGSSINCDNGVFGDPIVGVGKACFVTLSPSPGANAEPITVGGQTFLTGGANTSFNFTNPGNVFSGPITVDADGKISLYSGAGININSSRTVNIGPMQSLGDIFIAAGGLISRSVSGTTSSSSSPADVVVSGIVRSTNGNIAIVTDRDFKTTLTGSSDPQALQVSSGKQFLVLSNSPDTNTEGNLNYAFRQYGFDLGSSSSTILGAGSGFLYRTTPSVRLESVANATREYDATNILSNQAAGSIQISGQIGGDTITPNLRFDSSNVGVRTLTLVGDNGNTTLPVFTDANRGRTLYGYGIVSATTAVRGEITQRTLTLADLTVQNKVYDATTSALFSSNGLLNNVISGETVTADLSTAVATFNSKNVLEANTITVSNVILTGPTAANYRINPATVSAQILPRLLTVSGAPTADKTYDGTTSARITGATLTNLVEGETLNLQVAGSFLNKNAEANKSISVSYTLADGSAAPGSGSVTFLASNYVLSRSTETISANIAPALLTLAAQTDTKLYDRTDASTPGLVPIVSNLKEGDSISNLLQQFDSGSAGSRVTSVKSGYVINDGNQGRNYIVSTTNNVGFITPRTVTLTAQDKPYDGTTAATLSLEGILSGDTVSLLSNVGQFADRNASSAPITVTATPVLTGTHAGNYTFAIGSPTTTNTILVSPPEPFIVAASPSVLIAPELRFALPTAPASPAFPVSTVTTTARILPREITLSGIAVSNREYNGSVAASISSGILENVVAGELLTLTSTGRFADKTAKSGKNVTVNSTISDGVGQGAGLASNYRLVNPVVTTTADITRRALTVSGITAGDKVQDSTRSATVDSSKAILTGLVAGDDIKVSVIGQFADAEPGSNKLVTLTAMFSGSDVDNYQITPQANTTATITQRVQTTLTPPPAPAPAPAAAPPAPAPAPAAAPAPAPSSSASKAAPTDPLDAPEPAPAPAAAPAPAPAPAAQAPAPASAPAPAAAPTAPTAPPPASSPAPAAAPAAPPPPVAAAPANPAAASTTPVTAPPPSPVGNTKPDTPKDAADSGDKTLASAAPPPAPKAAAQPRRNIGVAPTVTVGLVNMQSTVPPAPPMQITEVRFSLSGASGSW